jgi:dynein heavy chain
VTWLSGLVNPQSFLTAICQVAAQKNQWELDKLLTWTEVTKKISVEEVEGASRDGAYINGLSVQGMIYIYIYIHIYVNMFIDAYTIYIYVNIHISE